MHTIIGLLAATGMRVGEALRLRVPDLDVNTHVLLVHGRKTPLDRYVPLHPSTTTAITTYLSCPERLATHPCATGPVFVNARGSDFVLGTIEQHFAALVDDFQLVAAGQKRPRMHDLQPGA